MSAAPFTGAILRPAGGQLPVADTLTELPWGLFVTSDAA